MIWCDMDGVLVQPDNEDFSKRSWTPDGKELWAFLAPLGASLLSWGRTGQEFNRIQAEKTEWIGREIGEVDFVILPDTPKADYCRPGDVLIDDSPAHRAAWESAGGRFILHRSAADTMREMGRADL